MKIRVNNVCVITDSGLVDDYINSWSHLGSTLNLLDMAKSGSAEDLAEIERARMVIGEKIRSYWEYVKSRFDGPELETITTHSIEESVGKVDELVEEYNHNRERLARDLDVNSINGYLGKIEEIIRGEAK